MRTNVLRFALAVVCVLTVAKVTGVRADEDDILMRATLTGFQEVGAPVLAPNASTTHGTFTATLDETGTALTYKLTWTAFATPIKFAHIHFAMRGVNGNIMAFLCSNTAGAPSAPPLPPPCSGGVATGTITAASIQGSAAIQGVTAGDFKDFLRAIRAGDGYANMHTNAFPGGEIRGQIAVFSTHDKDDKDNDDHQ